MSEKTFVPVGNILPPMPCAWSVGPYLERFYADLGKKLITGVKCANCGKVYVPPRKSCTDCGGEMTAFVKVKDTGRLANFTVAHQTVAGLKRETPVIIGLVLLDGAGTAVLGEVRGIEPAKLKTGLRLRAVFAEQPGNTVESISHFAPARKGG